VTNLDRLLETVDLLEHIAEEHADTQAYRTDPVEAAWLTGYRQALKDLKDAHDLHTAAHPERTTA
jgi:hypothetical protein